MRRERMRGAMFVCFLLGEGQGGNEEGEGEDKQGFANQWVTRVCV